MLLFKSRYNLLLRVITAGVACLFLFNSIICVDDAEALAIWSAMQRVDGLRTQRVEMLERHGYIKFALPGTSEALQLDAAKACLKVGEGGILILRPSLKDDPLTLLRMIQHAKTQLLMLALPGFDNSRYEAIEELFRQDGSIREAYLALFPENKAPELSVRDMIAAAFELIVLSEEKLMSDREMNPEESDFFHGVQRLVRGHPEYFSEIFRNTSARDTVICTALANGLPVFQADILENAPIFLRLDKAVQQNALPVETTPRKAYTTKADAKVSHEAHRDDHEGHGHHHHEHSDDGEHDEGVYHAHVHTGNIKKLSVIFAMTFGFACVELVSGFMTGSVALTGDACHMFTDSMGIGAALFALWANTWDRPPSKSYEGNTIYEVGAALLNGITVILASVHIGYKGIARLAGYSSADMSYEVFLVASLGLLVNVIAIYLIHSSKDHNLNLNGAYRHIMADTAGSFAAILSGLCIWTLGAYKVDSVLGLGIGAVIFYGACGLVYRSIHAVKYEQLVQIFLKARLKISLWIAERRVKSIFFDSRLKGVRTINGWVDLLKQEHYHVEREKAKELLILVLGDFINRVRSEALAGLERLDATRDDFIKGCRQVLRSVSPAACENAVRRLGDLDDRGSLKEILRLFTNTTEQVRRAALETAIKLGATDEEIKETLERTHKSTMIAEIRAFAERELEALKRPSPKVAELISSIQICMRKAGVVYPVWLLGSAAVNGVKEFHDIDIAVPVGAIVAPGYDVFIGLMDQTVAAPLRPEGDYKLRIHGLVLEQLLGDTFEPLLHGVVWRITPDGFRAITDPAVLKTQADLDMEADMPPSGSIYRVFEELLKEDKPFTAEEIASNLGVRPASIEPDIRALLYHLGLARRDVSMKGRPIVLSYAARKMANRILPVLRELYAHYGYRPTVSELREFEPLVTRMLIDWPKEPEETGDPCKNLMEWAIYLSKVAEIAAGLDNANMNSPKRYFLKTQKDASGKTMSRSEEANFGYWLKHGIVDSLQPSISIYWFVQLGSKETGKMIAMLPQNIQDIRSLFNLLEELSQMDTVFFKGLSQPPDELGSEDRPFSDAFVMNYVTKQVFGGPEGHRNLRVLGEVVERMRGGMDGMERAAAEFYKVQAAEPAPDDGTAGGSIKSSPTGDPANYDAAKLVDERVDPDLWDGLTVSFSHDKASPFSVEGEAAGSPRIRRFCELLNAVYDDNELVPERIKLLICSLRAPPDGVHIGLSHDLSSNGCKVVDRRDGKVWVLFDTRFIEEILYIPTPAELKGLGMEMRDWHKSTKLLLGERFHEFLHTNYSSPSLGSIEDVMSALDEDIGPGIPVIDRALLHGLVLKGIEPLKRASKGGHNPKEIEASKFYWNLYALAEEAWVIRQFDSYLFTMPDRDAGQSLIDKRLANYNRRHPHRSERFPSRTFYDTKVGALALLNNEGSGVRAEAERVADSLMLFLAAFYPALKLSRSHWLSEMVSKNVTAELVTATGYAMNVLEVIYSLCRDQFLKSTGRLRNMSSFDLLLLRRTLIELNRYRILDGVFTTMAGDRLLDALHKWEIDYTGPDIAQHFIDLIIRNIDHLRHLIFVSLIAGTSDPEDRLIEFALTRIDTTGLQLGVKGHPTGEMEDGLVRDGPVPEIQKTSTPRMISDDARSAFWRIDKYIGDRKWFTIKDYLKWDMTSDEAGARRVLSELIDEGFLVSRGSDGILSFSLSITATFARHRIKMNINDMPSCLANPDVLARDIKGLCSGFRAVRSSDLLNMILALLAEDRWRDVYGEALHMEEEGKAWKFMDTSSKDALLDRLKPLSERKFLDPQALEVGWVAYGGIDAERTSPETSDFREAAELANQYVREETDVGENEIKEIHRIMSRYLKVRNGFGRMRSVQQGVYRSDDASRNMVHYPSAENIPEAMREALNLINTSAFKAMHLVEQAAVAFYIFHNIQPFENGNTRTFSLFMNYILMRNNYPPLIINGDNEKRFHAVLRFMRKPKKDRLNEGSQKLSVFNQYTALMFQRDGALTDMRSYAREFTTFLAEELSSLVDHTAGVAGDGAALDETSQAYEHKVIAPDELYKLRDEAGRNAAEAISERASSIMVDGQTGGKRYLKEGDPFIPIQAHVYFAEGRIWDMHAGIELPGYMNRIINTSRGALLLTAGPFYMRQEGSIDYSYIRPLSDQEVYERFGLARVYSKDGKPFEVPALGIEERSILLPIPYIVTFSNPLGGDDIRRHVFGLEFKATGTPAYKRHNVNPSFPATVIEEYAGKPGIFLDWPYSLFGNAPVGLSHNESKTLVNEARFEANGGTLTRMTLGVSPLGDSYYTSLRAPLSDYRRLKVFFNEYGHPNKKAFDRVLSELGLPLEEYLSILAGNYGRNLRSLIEAGLMQAEHGSIINCDIFGYCADLGDFYNISESDERWIRSSVNDWVDNLIKVLRIAGPGHEDNMNKALEEFAASFIGDSAEAGAPKIDIYATDALKNMIFDRAQDHIKARDDAPPDAPKDDRQERGLAMLEVLAGLTMLGVLISVLLLPSRLFTYMSESMQLMGAYTISGGVVTLNIPVIMALAGSFLVTVGGIYFILSRMDNPSGAADIKEVEEGPNIALVIAATIMVMAVLRGIIYYYPIDADLVMYGISIVWQWLSGWAGVVAVTATRPDVVWQGASLGTGWMMLLAGAILAAQIRRGEPSDDPAPALPDDLPQALSSGIFPAGERDLDVIIPLAHEIYYPNRKDLPFDHRAILRGIREGNTRDVILVYRISGKAVGYFYGWYDDRKKELAFVELGVDRSVRNGRLPEGRHCGYELTARAMEIAYERGMETIEWHATHEAAVRLAKRWGLTCAPEDRDTGNFGIYRGPIRERGEPDGAVTRSVPSPAASIVSGGSANKASAAPVISHAIASAIRPATTQDAAAMHELSVSINTNMVQPGISHFERIILQKNAAAYCYSIIGVVYGYIIADMNNESGNVNIQEVVVAAIPQKEEIAGALVSRMMAEMDNRGARTFCVDAYDSAQARVFEAFGFSCILPSDNGGGFFALDHRKKAAGVEDHGALPQITPSLVSGSPQTGMGSKDPGDRPLLADSGVWDVITIVLADLYAIAAGLWMIWFDHQQPHEYKSRFLLRWPGYVTLAGGFAILACFIYPPLGHMVAELFTYLYGLLFNDPEDAAYSLSAIGTLCAGGLRKITSGDTPGAEATFDDAMPYRSSPPASKVIEIEDLALDSEQVSMSLGRYCTKACPVCLFSPLHIKEGEAPDPSNVMSWEVLRKIIEMVNGRKVKVLNLDGEGEPFLEFDKILYVIEHARVGRIFLPTNGFWGRSEDDIREIFRLITNASQKNASHPKVFLRVSTDEYHGNIPEAVRIINAYFKFKNNRDILGRNIIFGVHCMPGPAYQEFLADFTMALRGYDISSKPILYYHNSLPSRMRIFRGWRDYIELTTNIPVLAGRGALTWRDLSALRSLFKMKPPTKLETYAPNRGLGGYQFFRHDGSMTTYDGANPLLASGTVFMTDAERLEAANASPFLRAVKEGRIKEMWQVAREVMPDLGDEIPETGHSDIHILDFLLNQGDEVTRSMFERIMHIPRGAPGRSDAKSVPPAVSSVSEDTDLQRLPLDLTIHPATPGETEEGKTKMPSGETLPEAAANIVNSLERTGEESGSFIADNTKPRGSIADSASLLTSFASRDDDIKQKTVDELYVARLDDSCKACKDYERKGQGLILYADDILNSAAMADFEDTVKKMLVEHNMLEGGKIILFARERLNAIALEHMIKRSGPDIEVITITEEELRELKPDSIKGEVTEAGALLKYAKAKGAGDILAIIRGPVKSPTRFAKFAARSKVPVIQVGVEKAFYSFAQAIAVAMQIKKTDGKKGWLWILPPVQIITKDIEERYQKYRLSLQALVAA